MDTTAEQAAPSLDLDQVVVMVQDMPDATLLAKKGAESAERIYQQVREYAEPQIFDIETEKGRKNLKGLVKRVGSVKLRIDEKFKSTIDELEKSIVPMRAERARIKKQFEAFQEQLKGPYLEWENKATEEANRANVLRDRINAIRAMGDPIVDGRELSKDELIANKSAIEALEISDADFGVMINDAEQAKAIALRSVQNGIAAAEHLANVSPLREDVGDLDINNGPTNPAPDNQRSGRNEAQSVSDIMAESMGAIPPTGTAAIAAIADVLPEDAAQRRREALAAMMAFNLPEDATREDIFKQIISAIHKGAVPHITISYS
ncbi:hypothetical protein [uncultured Paraglaciecola sp.]|uniref:hypothetical protein n=1 Tax=uncultured Paraglaciecola sp. TaxID=1765024 RepID=UPI0026217071|nr:hypothetical protein [uncultured Paraglaciecola sp.]